MTPKLTSIVRSRGAALAAGFALAMVVGCNHEREKLPAEHATVPADSNTVKVTVQPVTFRPVQRIVGVVGTLHGYEEIKLKAKVAGRVRKILHDTADRVTSGELLLEVDPTDYQLNVRQAQKSLLVELAKLGLAEPPGAKLDVTRIPTVLQAQLKCENARTRLDRAEKLIARKAGTDEELSDKTSEYRVARAEYDNQVLLARAGIAAIQVKQEALAISQQQLQDALIKVPAPSQPIPGGENGVHYAITGRSVSEGSYVMAGDELFKLVIEQPLKFRGRVPERKSGEVRLGQRAEVYTAAYPQPFHGEVTRINPSIDPPTRTFEVEILVPNKQGELKPGAFAKTAILTALDEHAPTVPLESLVHVAGVTKIFLVVDGRAKQVLVTLGVQGTEWVEVSSPALPEGAQVVTSGQTVIADGTEVAVRAVTDQKAETLAADSAQRKNATATEPEPMPVARRETGAVTISEICIRRPVFTWVLVAIPVVLGAVSYFELGVDLFPKVDFPVVSVMANLPGTSPEEMETSVTRPIEEAINTVSGVDELRSTVREGVTTIVVQFVLEKNGDVAAQEIRDKISGIMKQMPEGMDVPLVDKFNLDSAPIMTIGISGRRDVREVTELAKHEIQEVLPQVPGVGRVFLSGGHTRTINVNLDPYQLTSYSLSVEDVRQAMLTQHLEVPGGIVQQGPRELVLRTLGRIKTAEQFDELIVSNRDGYPIRIKDLGHAEDSIEEPRGLTRLDGQNAVSLFVQKQSGTNTVKVVDGVVKLLDEIRKRLPADIRIELVNDQSRFVRRSMEEVKFHLLLAGVLVSLTILLFIRDWRTTVIATLAIPTSIIPTFLFMSRMGFTLNNITMLALILAIGIVIDDAVVVHENIFRHMEEGGLDAMTAARKGTKEIALAVLATSLSLVVIFLPVAFMGGMVGRFFSSFGMTVAFAILMSLFVSFTLTPMLCSRFLKLDPADAGHAGSKSGFVYRTIDWFYGKSLLIALRFRWAVVLVCIGVVACTGPIARRMGANLVPRDDQSEFQIAIITPEGYTLERADRAFTEIENRVARLPGILHRFTVIGENNNSAGKGQGDVTRGSIYFRMKELEDREYTQSDIMERARAILKEYPDLRAAVNDVSAIQAVGQDSRIFQLLLSGPELEKLASYSDSVLKELRHIPGLSDVDTTLSLRKPEVQVTIDRERASDLGIPIQTIANTLNVLVGGQPISRFTDGTEQYDVWLRADKQFRANPQTVDVLTVHSPKVGLVQLSSLAKVTESRGPAQIDRFNRQRTVTILANPEKISLNEAVQKSTEILTAMNLPPQYHFEFSGQARTLGETFYYFVIALGLSLLFMYLILAAQFESWMNPMAILAALPVTIPFGLLSLILFRQPMDLYAMFGLFMLVGIVKKNGILQVDKTNELRRLGMSRDAAIIEANHTRLRPILMTTAMLVAAMIPIALGQGPGAGARASMAKVIIGGQMLSLLLALLVTPVTYSLLDSFTGLFRRKESRPAVAELVTADSAG